MKSRNKEQGVLPTRPAFARYRLLLGLLILTTGAEATPPPPGIWDVFAHGAKGDGTALDTGAIQAATDACHAAGGGRVYLPNGRFRAGTLRLKSNVVLHVEAGATLLGSTQLDDFASTSSPHPSYTGEFVTGKMFLHAEDAAPRPDCRRGSAVSERLRRQR